MLTVICGITVLTVLGQQTTASQPQQYYDIPINIEAPVQPIPVKGAEGKWYLVYHLFLTNLGFSDLTLKPAFLAGGAAGEQRACGCSEQDQLRSPHGLLIRCCLSSA